MEDQLISQFTASGIAVWLIQKIKAAKWLPFITDETNGFNRTLAALLATLSTVGIVFTYDPAGALTITGLTLANGVMLAWKVAGSLVMQEIIYRGAVKK